MLSSWVVSIVVCSAIVAAFAVQSAEFLHWFILPVFACGLIITRDGVDWIRGRQDIFDPVGIIGLLGIHFFFIAPLLHVHWDFWLWIGRWSAYVPEPRDWRPWLGWMSVINMVGLIVYSTTWRWIVRRPVPERKRARVRLMRRRRFVGVLAAMLLLSFAAQLFVYARFGGLGGYVTAYERGDVASFRGLGPLFMISESFPILAMFAWAIWAKRRPWAKSWVMIAVVLAVFFALKLLFGGLRGSRSNTIWGLFWAVGIVHLWIRPIPKKLVAIGLVIMFAFLYVYGFYKGVGRDAIRAFESTAARQELEVETGRTPQSLLLGDLGRTDVQTYILYNLNSRFSDFEPAWGRTYLAATTLVIPRAIWPNRPERQSKEGAEIFFGRGTYRPGRRYSSRVHGLTGEGMLNFPPVVVPLMFVFLGLVVGGVHRFGSRLRKADVRLLMIPFAVNLCFLVLASDSTNIVFFIFKNGLLPALVVWVGSATWIERRVSASRAPERSAPAGEPGRGSALNALVEGDSTGS